MSGKYKPRFTVCFHPGCAAICESGRRLCPGHRQCTVDGCTKPKANGLLCATHKKHARRERLKETICSEQGCIRPVWYVTKGLCAQHGTDRSRDRKIPATPERRERMRVAALWRNYRLTAEAYEALVRSQLGACAICCRPEEGGRNLAVDHDHSCCPGSKSCGRCVRGLLCRACNNAIGMMRDDRAIIMAALVYLEPTRLRVVS
jgi:hypothetical protein